MDKQLSPLRPILLVDDEEAWLHGFSLTLRSVGLSNIRCCPDSRKVMEILAHEEVGVIVSISPCPISPGKSCCRRSSANTRRSR
jgi:hypothetical protein